MSVSIAKAVLVPGLASIQIPLAPGASIASISLSVTIAFSASASLTLGSTAGASDLLASTPLDSTGAAILGCSNPNGHAIVYATISGTPTVGTGFLFINYLSAAPNPATSGSASLFPDILDMAQEAAERAGIDFTSGQMLRSAKLSLDLLSMEWSNEGLNLWTIDFQSTPFVAGQFTYPLLTDTMDVVYPFIRTTRTDGSQIDIPLSRFDFAGYAAIPNKILQGKPLQIFVHRTANPEVIVWPIPNTPSDGSTWTLCYYRMRRMADTGAATNSMDIPYRFVPAMIAGLALKMAMKSRDGNVAARIPMLKGEYNEAFMKAKYEDRDRSSLYLTPALY